MSSVAQRLPNRFAHISMPETAGWSLGVGDLFTLFVPLVEFIRIETVGVLYLSDLLLLGALPIVLARRGVLYKNKQVRWFLILALIWLVSQVLTDLWRNSTFEDYSRGWSKIFLTITHFATIWGLLRNSIKRAVLFGVGLCVGGVLTSFINPTDTMTVDAWKFGLGIPITLLAILAIGCHPRLSRRLVILVLIGLSVFNVFEGFRSLGLICLATAVFHLVHSRRRRIQIRKKHVIVAIPLLAAGLWGFVQAYGYCAEQGYLGEQARHKFQLQSAGAGLLLGGRTEILSSGQAILDSPVLGHGSWARDPKYAGLMVERLEALGYRNLRSSNHDLIPTHSHLFGAWVESGTLGAAFWIWVLVIVIRCLLNAPKNDRMLPLFLFIGLLLCWDILFSPYGADQRFFFAFSFAVLVIAQSRSTPGISMKGFHRA